MRVFPEPKEDFSAAIYAIDNHRYITDAESKLADFTDDEITDIWKGLKRVLDKDYSRTLGLSYTVIFKHQLRERDEQLRNFVDENRYDVLYAILVLVEISSGDYESAKNAHHELMTFSAKLAEGSAEVYKKAFYEIHPAAVSGHKVIKGGKKGHEGRYGTAEEKIIERVKYMDTCLAIYLEDENLGLTKIRRKAAKRHNVSLRTMETHTKNLAHKIKSN